MRPISLGFIIATALILLTMALPAVRKKKSAISEHTDAVAIFPEALRNVDLFRNVASEALNRRKPIVKYLLAFACKRSHFCPSCHQKRIVEFEDWLSHARIGYRMFRISVNPKLFKGRM